MKNIFLKNKINKGKNKKNKLNSVNNSIFFFTKEDKNKKKNRNSSIKAIIESEKNNFTKKIIIEQVEKKIKKIVAKEINIVKENRKILNIIDRKKAIQQKQDEQEFFKKIHLNRVLFDKKLNDKIKMNDVKFQHKKDIIDTGGSRNNIKNNVENKNFFYTKNISNMHYDKIKSGLSVLKSDLFIRDKKNEIFQDRTQREIFEIQQNRYPEIEKPKNNDIMYNLKYIQYM